MSRIPRLIMATRFSLSVILLLFSVSVIMPAKGYQSRRVPASSSRRPQESSSQATLSFSQLAAMTSHPSLIVFDLDQTLWSPELYQLRKLQGNNQYPVAGKDVKLYGGAKFALDAIRSGQFPHTKFAVASRTKSVDWAHDLLDQFGIRELLHYIEIFPGHKRTHFEKIAEASGVAFRDMLFFDDARDGKYGNCLPVSEMGVLSVHCPGGLHTEHVFLNALQRFEEWNRTPGHIVEWDGALRSIYTSETIGKGERQNGVVKAINAEKRYGFIKYGDSNTPDLFFHFNNLPKGKAVVRGDTLSFVVKSDPQNGKNVASSVEIESSSSLSSSPPPSPTNTVTMRTFSMNLPFAALLANGYKTLETRNGTMFVQYPEGTQMLLHVGRRTYPDANKHIDVMKSGGLSENDIEKLKSLPRGFGKGMAVAIVEIGKTYETTVDQRSDPEFQRKVAAFGFDSGKMVTEIRRVQYLKHPVNVSGQGGVFNVQIDPELIPDGWIVPPGTGDSAGTAKSGKPLYSLSG